MRVPPQDWCSARRAENGRPIRNVLALLLACMAMNGPGELTAFARVDLEEGVQRTTRTAGSLTPDRPLPAPRPASERLGVYGVLVAVLGAGDLTAPSLRTQLTDSPSLPVARVTLAQPEVEGAGAPVATATLHDQVLPKPHAAFTARVASAWETRMPDLRQPWRFQDNGGTGFKTWVSDHHALDFNPCWLDFSMFDSMQLDVMDGPLGPGESEPPIWRSTITVGMGAEWAFHPGLALQAGYRFYDNPMPAQSTSGAFLNAMGAPSPPRDTATTLPRPRTSCPSFTRSPSDPRSPQRFDPAGPGQHSADLDCSFRSVLR